MLSAFVASKEALGYREDSILIEHKSFFVDASIVKFKLLGYAHSLYHAVRHDRSCFADDGSPLSPRLVQKRASDLQKALRALVSSGVALQALDTQGPHA